MSEKPIFAVIMAGGQGVRLWPLSRASRPKQFLALTTSGRTLLQEAARRATELTGSTHNILVTAQSGQANLVREQLPDLPPENLLLEPVGRNTAPCLALAAFHLRSRAPDAVMAVLPVDHLFVHENPWFDAIHAAVAYAAASDSLVTIGLKPQAPSSNFGYLHLGQVLEDREPCPVYQLQKFIEKPDRDRAESFLASGEYLWNTGTFAWRVSTFWQAVETYLPQVASALEGWGASPTPETLESIYPTFENISVDYAIMEKSSNVAAVRGAFQRIDVGSLGNLSELWPEDAQGNAALGEVLLRDSQDNVIYTDKGLVSLLGVQGLVVVRAGEVVLVCPRERAGEVRELVALLQRSNLERYR
jgi:mannose-1-phosphate guanylyltransferase